MDLLHEDDKVFLEEFNLKHKGSPFELKGQLMSEPFIGNPKTAKIIFLALNPGYDERDDEAHKNQAFQKLISDNIALRDSEYPYYYMHEREPFKDYPGCIWCKRIFKELLNEVGAKILSKEICCIQFHGYHSTKYRQLSKFPLPSQRRTFDFIRDAIKREIPIVLMRSTKIWTVALPELTNYRLLIHLNNPRNPTISRGNMQEGDFDMLLKALNQRAK
jgi:hypothetical protein